MIANIGYYYYYYESCIIRMILTIIEKRKVLMNVLKAMVNILFNESF